MKQLIFIVFLLGLIHILRQMIKNQDKLEGFAASEGSTFNKLVDDLRNGMVLNDLKVTGNVIVDGDSHFHDYVVLNSWTGFATKGVLFGLKDRNNQNYLTDTQIDNAVVIGGTNENSSAAEYWFGYKDKCKAANCAVQL